MFWMYFITVLVMYKYWKYAVYTGTDTILPTEFLINVFYITAK